jgi:transcriptional accessory protein Tex/SPT6
MHARRFTRLTNASSRKVENHAHAVVLEDAVTTVAAFGAFVDIGVHQDGLVQALSPRNFGDDIFGLLTVTDIMRELEKPGRGSAPGFQGRGVHGGRRNTQRPKARHGASIGCLWLRNPAAIIAP